MPPFGWRYGPRWSYYYSGKEVDRDTVEKNAEAVLSQATKGQAWTDPRGVKHIPIVVSGGVVGDLWEDVDLKKLRVGAYWAAGFGVKAELVQDGKVVGTTWVSA